MTFRERKTTVRRERQKERGGVCVCVSERAHARKHLLAAAQGGVAHVGVVFNAAGTRVTVTNSAKIAILMQRIAI
jgi:hypothetical protein